MNSNNKNSPQKQKPKTYAAAVGVPAADKSSVGAGVFADADADVPLVRASPIASVDSNSNGGKRRGGAATSSDEESGERPGGAASAARGSGPGGAKVATKRQRVTRQAASDAKVQASKRNTEAELRGQIDALKAKLAEKDDAAKEAEAKAAEQKKKDEETERERLLARELASAIRGLDVTWKDSPTTFSLNWLGHLGSRLIRGALPVVALWIAVLFITALRPFEPTFTYVLEQFCCVVIPAIVSVLLIAGLLLFLLQAVATWLCQAVFYLRTGRFKLRNLHRLYVSASQVSELASLSRHVLQSPDLRSDFSKRSLLLHCSPLTVRVTYLQVSVEEILGTTPRWLLWHATPLRWLSGSAIKRCAGRKTEFNCSLEMLSQLTDYRVLRPGVDGPAALRRIQEVASAVCTINQDRYERSNGDDPVAGAVAVAYAVREVQAQRFKRLGFLPSQQ